VVRLPFKEVIGKGKIFSKAVIFGDLIFLSGIGPRDPETESIFLLGLLGRAP